MREAQMAGIRLKLIYAIAALRSAEPCSVKPVYLGLQELRRGRRVSTPARPPCRLWRGGAPAASAISERLFHRHAYIYVCTLRLPTRTAVEFTFFAALASLYVWQWSSALLQSDVIGFTNTQKWLGDSNVKPLSMESVHPVDLFIRLKWPRR